MSSARRQRRRPRGAPERGLVREITPSGEGLAVLDDGRRVLVGGVAPGETVLVRPESRGNRARLEQILSPSGDRVEPVCPHAARCGGCDLMHLGSPARRALYPRQLAEALQRSGFAELPPIAFQPAPNELGYRVRARLYVRAAPGAVRVGYRRERSHELVAFDRCAVLRPELGRALDDLPGWLEGSRGQGDAVAALGDGGRPVLELRWRGTLDARLFARIDAAVQGGEWAGARIWPEDALEPARFGDPRPLLRGPDGQPLRIAPGGFTQASEEGGAMLARRVADLVGEVDSLVELYAGSGTLSVALAPRARRMWAVESSAEAARALADNLAERGLHATIRVGDAGAYAIAARVDAVVLDPPRAGAVAAMARIAEARARRVVYVSCNVATLARDLAVLRQAGYALEDLTVLELFPQTSHFETVAHLSCARTRPRS